MQIATENYISIIVFIMFPTLLNFLSSNYFILWLSVDVTNMPPPRTILPDLPPTVAPTLPPLPFPSCGEVFTNASGSFSSPSYPTYTHNTDCAWMINGPEGHWLRLSFSPLNIEYRYVNQSLQFVSGKDITE